MTIKRQHAVAIALGVALLGLLGAAGWYSYRLEVDRYVYLGLGLAAAGLVAAAVIDRAALAGFFRGRRGRHGTNAMVASLSMLGILVIANYAAYRIPASADLTEDAQYSLAPETRATLASLTTPVRLIGFYSPDVEASRDNIRPLLQQYMDSGRGYVSYEFIDPRSQPLSADRYGVTRDGSVVVVMGAGSEVISFPTEQDLTGAIVRLANPGTRKVYFLTGHGERDIESAEPEGYSYAREVLESKNYEVAPLSLLGSSTIPEDALVVVVAGPTVPLREAEVAALRSYVDAGGSLLVLEEPTPGTGLEGVDDPLAQELAGAYGLRLHDDIALDRSSIYGLAVPFAADYGSHPIVDRLQRVATYFPTARSLEVAEADNANLSQVALVQTGDNSWGETNFKALEEQGSVEENASEDTLGPLTLAAAVEDFSNQSRLVVVGDVDFAANNDFYQGVNGDLLINSIDWAAGQEELISLTPKETTQRFVLPPTRQTALLIGLLTVVGIPGAVVAGGISTLVSRRRRG
ncbi:MAG TPA: GldG family protein [Anaerolineales bacterium]|nr:GldG family protein [Anaerolineales bacterium]